MDRAINHWLQKINLNVERPNNLKLSYTSYGCMLLLPARGFESTAWKDVFNRCSAADIELLYEHIAKHLKVTHIALNNPIPAFETHSKEENIIRSPTNFKPLYGDFGPTTCSSPPTEQDFGQAFWVTAKQNGIFQTWAPRWTMFSRGNISEKARLVSLPSVQEAVEEGRTNGKGCAAVDLYAGIGYFAFSYVKAGVNKVLCWDINPWSIEGLRRGAAANKWPAVFYNDGKALEAFAEKDTRLVNFGESNECANDRIETMRDELPPIRHVNCGILPSAEGSLNMAFGALDPALGGWVHVHQNCAIREVDVKAEEVRLAFQRMLDDHAQCSDQVQLEYINRLKSYAPGVMHCVLDIYVPPQRAV